MTAASSGSVFGTRSSRAASSPPSLSRSGMTLAISSRYTMRTPASFMAFSSASSSPSRMKVREVRTLFSSARPAAGDHGPRPRGKIDHGRNLFRAMQGQKAHQTGQGIGHHEAYPFLSAKRHGPESAEGLGFGQHGPVGQGMALLILGYDVGTTEYPHRIGKGLHDAAVDPGG